MGVGSEFGAPDLGLARPAKGNLASKPKLYAVWRKRHICACTLFKFEIRHGILLTIDYLHTRKKTSHILLHSLLGSKSACHSFDVNHKHFVLCAVTPVPPRLQHAQPFQAPARARRSPAPPMNTQGRDGGGLSASRRIGWVSIQPGDRLAWMDGQRTGQGSSSAPAGACGAADAIVGARAAGGLADLKPFSVSCLGLSPLAQPEERRAPPSVALAPLRP